MFRRNAAALFCLALCAGAIPARSARAQTPAPLLIAEEGADTAVAVEPVTRARDPFPFTQLIPFGADARTRVMLFAQNVQLLPGEAASALTASAEDASRNVHPLTVERVDPVPGFEWMSSVVVRLGDGMSDSTGEVLVSVTLRGLTSNRVRLRVGAQQPDLGAGASLDGKRPFPADNAWNRDVSAEPVDPNSANLIAGIGLGTSLHPDFGTVWNGAPNGIPYVVVSGAQAKVPIRFTAYGDESDPGPYPVPADAPVEGGPGGTGDRHVIVIDRDNWKLYELYRAFPDGAGWSAESGAVYDLNSNALRPAGWTSADAAGLPVFPGLVRYDEVFGRGEVAHAPRVRAAGAPLRQQQHRPEPPADGDEGEAQSLVRHLGLLARDAGHPARAQAVRDDSGRQREQLVRERRARPALERLGAEHAEGGQRVGLRGGEDGCGRDSVSRRGAAVSR
ncbi:MAG TPA: hypothetical protein VF586_20520 [Pyrinomonadaceae bacterium]|jgi:hypothetical protein